MNVLRNTLFRFPSARMFSSSRNLSVVAFAALFSTVISFPAFSEATQSESLPGEHEISNDPNSTWKEKWTTNIEEWDITVLRERQNGHFLCRAALQSISLKSFLLISFGEKSPIIEGFDFTSRIFINAEVYSFKTEARVLNNETVYDMVVPTQFDGRPEVHTIFFVNATEAADLELAEFVGVFGSSENYLHKSKDHSAFFYWLYELRTGAHTLNLKLNLTRSMVPETVVETYRIIGFQDVEAFCGSFVTLPP